NGSGQTVTVTGDHFRNGMSVLFDAPNGVWTWYDGGAITLHSDTSFTVKAMIDKAGLWAITVHNADGTESHEVQFNVVAPNAPNCGSSLSRSRPAPASSAFVMTCGSRGGALSAPCGRASRLVGGLSRSLFTFPRTNLRDALPSRNLESLIRPRLVVEVRRG